MTKYRNIKRTDMQEILIIHTIEHKLTGRTELMHLTIPHLIRYHFPKCVDWYVDLTCLYEIHNFVGLAKVHWALAKSLSRRDTECRTLHWLFSSSKKTNAHQLIARHRLAHAVMGTISSLYLFLLIYLCNNVFCVILSSKQLQYFDIHVICWLRGMNLKLAGSSDHSRLTSLSPRLFDTNNLR